eukprot:765907-Hanusia_phi.AAC.4
MPHVLVERVALFDEGGDDVSHVRLVLLLVPAVEDGGWDALDEGGAYHVLVTGLELFPLLDEDVVPGAVEKTPAVDQCHLPHQGDDAFLEQGEVALIQLGHRKHLPLDLGHAEADYLIPVGLVPHAAAAGPATNAVHGLLSDRDDQSLLELQLLFVVVQVEVDLDQMSAYVEDPDPRRGEHVADQHRVVFVELHVGGFHVLYLRVEDHAVDYLPHAADHHALLLVRVEVLWDVEQDAFAMDEGIFVLDEGGYGEVGSGHGCRDGDAEGMGDDHGGWVG